MAGNLTPKQAMFVAQYQVDGNGTRAAIACGVPVASASVTAARWLKMPKVARAIALAYEQRTGKLDRDAERVLEELRKLAFFDPGKLYDREGNRIPVHQLDDWTRAAVASVEDETQTQTSEELEGRSTSTVTRRQRIKMSDKGQNLERLGRYHKLFTDKIEGSLKVTLEELVCGGGGDQSGEPAHS